MSFKGTGVQSTVNVMDFHRIIHKELNKIIVNVNGFDTEFQLTGYGGTGVTIKAQGGTGDLTDSRLRNQILNVVPLIRNDAVYTTTRPNMPFTTPYITFITDTAGRVKEISTTLSEVVPAANRRRDDSESQRAKDVKNGNLGTPPDDGGHMIASLFDGTVEQINYFPQSRATNRGPWLSMEREWRTQREAGVSVHVNIKVEFPATNSNNRRPIRFIVNFEYGGNPQPEKRILNP